RRTPGAPDNRRPPPPSPPSRPFNAIGASLMAPPAGPFTCPPDAPPPTSGPRTHTAPAYPTPQAIVMNPPRPPRRLPLARPALASARALPACLAALASAAGPVAPVPRSVLLAPLYAPLALNTSFGEGRDWTLVHITVTLRAGEKRRVVGRLETTANRTPGE